jgi:hypothetical protein
VCGKRSWAQTSPRAYLGDKFRNGSDVVQCPLRVGNTHNAIHEVDLAKLARVVISILRTGDGVQVQVDTETIFATPRQYTQNVPSHQIVWLIISAGVTGDLLPADLCQEWLSDGSSRSGIHTNVGPGLDCPEGDRQANPIQPCASNLRDVLLGNEGVIVVFHNLGEILPSGDRAISKRLRCQLWVLTRQRSPEKESIRRWHWGRAGTLPG